MQRRFWLLPLILLIIASLVSQFSTLDLFIVNQFYDVSSQQWYFGPDYWLTKQLHDRGRDLIAIIFILSLLGFVISYIRPGKWRYLRLPALYLGLCILLTTGIVGANKHYSDVDCPRDLKNFGGSYNYVQLFSARPANESGEKSGGHCFPGGHSSGAFSLYGLFFLALFYQPGHARKLFYLVTVLGMSYAILQWSRGAHFPIHDIWSAAIGWYTSLILAWVMVRYWRHPLSQKGMQSRHIEQN